MDSNTQNKLNITFRYILSGLFLLSAISKLLPIGFFEKMLVDLNVATWESTVYISRTILTIEFFLAFALLQDSFFKKIIVPGTAALLLVFTGHLFYEGFTNPKGFFEGNCGCFGDLIPLSIFWSIVKNAVMLGLLYYVWKNTKPEDKRDFKLVIIMLFGAILSTMIMANPIPKYITDLDTNTFEVNHSQENVNPIISTDTLSIDSLSQSTDSVQAIESTDNTTQIKETVKPEEIKTKNTTTQDSKTDKPQNNTTTDQTTQTTTVKSKFSSFRNFSDGKVTNLDKGRKLVCLFSLTCEHCQASYKELCQWGQKTDIPDIYILAYGSTDDVPYFFEQAGSGCNHPYQLMDYMKFMPLLGDYNFPMIVLMEDGKELGVWDYDTYSFDKVKAAVEKLQ